MNLKIVAPVFFLTAALAFAKPPSRNASGHQQKPEELLAAAKKACGDRAWRVEARINGDKDLKISGIVSGNDFDLTTETIEGASRQITVGEKSWVSGDGGKTWKEGDAQDRRSYYLVHTPIKFSPERKIPPFEKVKEKNDQDGSIAHVRFIAPQKITYEGDRPNWWIAPSDPQGPTIRRYCGPGVYEQSTVTTDAAYTAASDSPAVMPPPGNPHAAAESPGAEALLMTAMKKMKAGVWSVNANIAAKKTVKVHGLLSGEDFDLSMEPGTKPNTPLRGIVIGQQGWVCADGETWHPGRSDDRVVYNWVHTPILSGRMEPPFEKVVSEQHNGQSWLLIRLKVPEKNADPNELPQYSLVLDPQGQPQYIAHASMPMFSNASSSVLHCAIDYAPVTQKIAPPSLGSPVDDAAHSFNDIEQHKFDWANKIVRIEVTPKLLQSEQIGESTYRGFLKDTAGHYGQVEFPFDGLVKTGFLKKVVPGTHSWNDLEKMGTLARTEGAPVSLYVEVIPIGEKPAARTVVVGAKVSREADGTARYSW